MKGGAPLALVGLLVLIMGLRGTYKDVWQSLTGAYKGANDTNAVKGTDTNKPASGGNPRGWGSPRWAPVGYPGSMIVPPQ